MEPRGRGRARGRARGGSSGSGFQEPRPGPPQYQGATGGTRGSRGRARGAPSLQQPVQMAATAPAPGPWGARSETQAPPPTQATQRPERFEPPGRMDTTPRSMETGAGDGESSTSRGGNGGVRGRTLRSEYVYTKPQTVTRKQGSSGTIVNLSANYFKLLQAGKWGLNQYRVDFNPDIDHTGQRKALMHIAMQNVLTGYLFDGTVLYTPQTIHPDPMEKLVQNKNEERIIISVRRVGDVAWGDYHYIHLFNMIIRNCFRFMKFELIQRNYFDPHSKVVLKDHNLEIWPGFSTSMRQQEADILMNCNVTFKVVRTENVYDLLAHCNSSGNPRANFRMSIIGIVVLTYYNNKSYRIDDVDYNTSPTSTFPMRDGSQISFIDYYKKKYNINIQNPRQPMLVSRSSAREIRSGMPETVLLIPELCQMTGLTDQQRENFHLMKSLADHTRIAPNARINKLKQFSDRMARCPEAMAELKRWDLNIAKDLIKFQGRVLNPEAIIGGNNAKYSAGNQADWTRELRNLPMFETGVLSRLAVLCPSKFVSNCQEFMRCLQRAASGMSWSIGQYKVIELHGDRTQNYLESIESVINADKPSMIMCIVPNNNSDRYSSIKKKLIVDRGVPSQIILAKNLASKGVMSIATKVAIQLNCKVGGAPWTVAMPLSNLMIVGYDVCRDTANRGKCFAAMVASLNKQATRYYNQTFEHMQEQELSDNFGAFMRLACMKYKELNGQYPDRILIYRDGVGEGQLPYVHENEVVNIKKKLTAEIYKDKELKLAFVVVNKRINTRIFTANEANPEPGTVVDDVITQPERYDFYIVSQCVRQGTVTPTSYNVIEDTMGLPPDRMQMLTYKMCHMYYNWSGTVRVPAPCQYAHKLAFLTAQSLHRAAHRTLEDILYYL